MNDHPTTDLSSYLDGAIANEAAAEVEKHLRECAECSAVARRERVLRRGLLVLACPSADVLGRFIDGSLDGPLLAGTKEHVARCADCAMAIEWTRDAAATLESGELPKASGRRRRPVLARRGSRVPILQLAIPLAAAAALVLAVLLITREPSRPDTGDVAEKNDRPPAHVTPPEKAPPPPQTTNPDRPAPPPPEETPHPPDEGPAPQAPPEMPPPAERPSNPQPPAPPPESERPGQAEPKAPPVSGAVAISNAGGDLRVGPSREKATRVAGSASVSPRDYVFASMAPGRFDLGDGPVLLGPQAEARLELLRGGPSPPAPAPPPPGAKVLLEKGEAYSEGNAVLACRGASARPDGTGAQLLLRAAPHGAQLFVCAGKAFLSSAGGEISLSAGEASEVDADAAPTRPHRGETSAWIAPVRAERISSIGLDYPRGFLAAESARALAVLVKTGTLLERARSLHAIEAARASDERFARTVSEIAGAAADASFDQIVDQADALSAPAAGLAVLARARRLPSQKDALARTFAGLAKTLEKATPAELDLLAKDADALLALKSFERAGARVKGLRERVLAEAAAKHGDLDWLARAALAGAPADALDLDARFKHADTELNKDAVVPANRLSPHALLSYERAQATAGSPADDDRRFFKVLEHLAAAGAKPCAGPNAPWTLLVLSRDAQVLAGRPAAPLPASVVILPRRDGQLEVTFAIQSAKNPKAITLGGSWDDWNKDRQPMTRRADGAFVETLVLPRGRYVYKLHLESSLWETDARNPLYESDGKGGNNSVLMLE